MTKDDGFTKVYRDIRKNWIWEDKPFGRGQAFIDLLLMANYKDKKIIFNGDLMGVKRGSRITSLRKLSEQWGWSTNKTKKFLEQLQRDNMITYISDNKKTLITIENYNSYQDRDNTEETQKKIKRNSEENQKKTPITIENYNSYQDRDNTEETEKEQSRDTEETQKKRRRKSKENQKKTNKKDKEYIKKDKEGEERKEEVSKLPPLFFPNPINKKIFDVVKDVGYRTWFMDAVIEETDNKIIITEKEEFKRNIIKERYSTKLYTWLGKEVEVKE